MEKQDFIELQKKVFASFVEQVKPTKECIEVREVHSEGNIHTLLYISKIDAKIEANYDEKEFVFTSGRASLRTRISVDFYMQYQSGFNEAYFISGANKLFAAFCKSARIICDAKNELLMTEAYVNGYPF